MRSTTSPPPRRRRLVALGTAVALTASGLAAATATAATASSASADPARGAATATTARATYLDARQPTARRVADLLGRMTLDEKVGQMTQAERGGIDADPTQITDPAAWAACCPAAARCPTPNTPEAWADMVDRYQRAALATRLGIPLIYGVDSVHGHGNLLGRHGLPAQHRPRRHP